MKNKIASFFAALAITIMFAGCATDRAKKHTLLPAIRMSVDSVKEMADAGVVTFPLESRAEVVDSIDTVFLAIAEGESEDIVVAYQADWPLVKQSAEQGVLLWLSDGTVGVLVSESLINEIKEFDASLAEYAH